MPKLDDLFIVKNGIPASGLTVLKRQEPGTLPLIRPASTQLRTLAGWVPRSEVKQQAIYPRETLFVSTDGEGSHTYAYVSQFDFVPNSNVSVLIPRSPMTVLQKVFYARCITLNRFLFSYGRKPKGERLKSITLPAAAPEWIESADSSSLLDSITELANKTSKPRAKQPDSIANETVDLADLFAIDYGTDLELLRLERDPNGINFVSRTSKNNGVSARVKELDSVKPTPAGRISVAGGGSSVLSAYVQNEPFYSGRDLFVLTPRFEFTEEELLFYCMCIRANQPRYNYGRQANKTLGQLQVPARKAIPRWVYGALKTVADEIAEQIGTEVVRPSPQRGARKSSQRLTTA
ncbi:restriction endonuclease [Burkholderia stagnalis]|uniref:restriction endonuclease n=1 Tax=Burkholderia stagnalis TaxID=1503054 RepID=UPI000A62216B|nr:restriction endonuclease [Burkholderia stagnalis]